jgi:hypothetical protein
LSFWNGHLHPAGGGCGALLSDAEAFASHCGEVEHDDDFAYALWRLRWDGDERRERFGTSGIHIFPKLGRVSQPQLFPWNSPNIREKKDSSSNNQQLSIELGFDQKSKELTTNRYGQNMAKLLFM